jgi:hypothetical protein
VTGGLGCHTSSKKTKKTVLSAFQAANGWISNFPLSMDISRAILMPLEAVLRKAYFSSAFSGLSRVQLAQTRSLETLANHRAQDIFPTLLIVLS